MADRKVKLIQHRIGEISALELDAPVVAECEIWLSEWEKHAGKPDNAIIDGVFVSGKDVEESYKELRRAAYPAVEDQLDMIYHDQKEGTTTWSDTISSVKAKYPKP